MIAMLLAGGQGSRLGVLTSKLAKPAVAFGGKYKIIDFPLSNCINSGIDTVGVLTQYQPLRLNQHIGIGIPWDLDRNIGGVTILPPYEKSENTDWYTGTANAIYQNMEFWPPMKFRGRMPAVSVLSSPMRTIRSQSLRRNRRSRGATRRPWVSTSLTGMC